ncbi:Hypothetical_protein [Hexamita inflata]|uniref:Hypothetical_protein n=1 Tax=Hexamita inflata TaxID=28002 RepID=A0AA86PUY4_9EUKA|nr:Hypothetical protein HINF_LOCUS31673 [Hexamita inflata]
MTLQQLLKGNQPQVQKLQDTNSFELPQSMNEFIKQLKSINFVEQQISNDRYYISAFNKLFSSVRKICAYSEHYLGDLDGNVYNFSGEVLLAGQNHNRVVKIVEQQSFCYVLRADQQIVLLNSNISFTFKLVSSTITDFLVINDYFILAHRSFSVYLKCDHIFTYPFDSFVSNLFLFKNYFCVSTMNCQLFVFDFDFNVKTRRDFISQIVSMRFHQHFLFVSAETLFKIDVKSWKGMIIPVLPFQSGRIFVGSNVIVNGVSRVVGFGEKDQIVLFQELEMKGIYTGNVFVSGKDVYGVETEMM